MAQAVNVVVDHEAAHLHATSLKDWLSQSNELFLLHDEMYSSVHVVQDPDHQKPHHLLQGVNQDFDYLELTYGSNYNHRSSAWNSSFNNFGSRELRAHISTICDIPPIFQGD